MPAFIKSVQHATRGLFIFFKTERNGKIQLSISLMAVVLGLYFHITSAEWCWVIISIVAVIGMEMINTALEHLCNLVSPDYHPAIKNIKDISAGAVWLVAIGAFVIGLFVFSKYIILIMNNILL